MHVKNLWKSFKEYRDNVEKKITALSQLKTKKNAAYSIDLDDVSTSCETCGVREYIYIYIFNP